MTMSPLLVRTIRTPLIQTLVSSQVCLVLNQLFSGADLFLAVDLSANQNYDVSNLPFPSLEDPIYLLYS